VIEEIIPGVLHWTAFRDTIGMDVHSYCVPESRVVIDPMEPDEGLDWFEQQRPERILLTNRHHYRHSGRFVDRFGCHVLCHRSGLHEFHGGPAIRGFEFGDEVAPGITAQRVAELCPEETAFFVAAGGGALSFADALVRADDGALRFVPDYLIGDDPEAVKAAMLESLRQLLELDFDNLLLAHGEPMVGGGKDALREFVEA
jgi:hypothetical protein